MAYVSFPGRASPVVAAQSFPVAASPTPTQQIQPGQITYTTTVGADGQVTYHPFRAVAASYQTSQGLVNGIQWVPAEATQVLPAGAMPASADIMASFSRHGDKEWQREEERRRRKEAERRERDEKELRRAREKDRQREGRLSNSYGSGHYEPDRKHSTAELERRFHDLEVDRREREREREYERERRSSFNAGTRSRRNSTYGDRPAGYQPAPGGPYPTAAAATTTAYPCPPASYTSPYNSPQAPYQKPPRPVSPYRNPPALPRPVSPYQNPPALPRPVSPYQNPGIVPRPVSPYQVGAMQRTASPRPLPGAYPVAGDQGIRPSLSRAPSPSPYPPPHYVTGMPATFPQAQYGQGAQYAAGYYQQGVPPEPPQSGIPPPEGFSRPPNPAQPYTHFEMMKIQDMDAFLEVIPRMPLVLVPHDVYHEDWIRLMNDLSLAWSGRLPVPVAELDGRPLKRTMLAADLLELWNASFFLARGVELVLYKGRERRSGHSAGTVDLHLPGFDTYDGVSSPSDDDSSESSDESDDDRYRYGAYGGAYGRQVDAQMAELREARSIRREKKLEHKKRKVEKKRRQRMKELEKKYALYLTCISPREGGLVPQM